MKARVNNKKLEHKIIVLTGAVASGKTTVKNIIINLLKGTGVQYREISGINDLYIPFAIKNGLISRKSGYQRQETTALMKRIYLKYGKTHGSCLLKDFLRNQPLEIIYLIDSKRNPEGINELKKLFRNVLVIGIHANFEERLRRYRLRCRKFDEINGVQQDPVLLFKHEEKLFNILKSITLCDVIIENHETLPHDISVSLYQGLVKKNYIAQPQNTHMAEFPEQPESGLITGAILTISDIPILLNIFLSENLNNNIFIIQGGNRYISSYLREKNKADIYDLKLLDLGKIKLGVILNTILSIQERVRPLNKTTKNKILAEFKELPLNKQTKINKTIKKKGLNSLNDLLTYATKSEIINTFADFIVKTPFSYPANDKKIKEEFNMALSKTKQTINKIKEKPIIKLLFDDTFIYKILTEPSKKVVFIDDVFYRGRTFFALNIITGLFDVLPGKWQLYTLCADQVSKKIYTKGLTILNRNVIYPFENSINTEGGYWEETKGAFIFRDMILYKDLLALSVDKNHHMNNTTIQWGKIIKQIIKKLDYKEHSNSVLHPLVEFYLFCYSHHINIDINSVLDQRGNSIGYCVPFMKTMSAWINQGAPRRFRQAFKNKIATFISKFISQKNMEYIKIIKNAALFYKSNSAAIDFEFLNKTLKPTLNIGTRECEIKYEINNNEEEIKIKKILKIKKFMPREEQIETDFIPDTSDFLCRQNNLLLRFRRIRNAKKDDILLTLKIGKTTHNGFQDARELQYYFSQIEPDIFESINTILQKATGIKLPYQIHDFHDLKELRAFLKNLGYPSLRTLVEKKRTTFTKGDWTVNFDIFPENLGKYIEIETQTPEELNLMISMLALPQNRLEVRDYGDIIKAKKSTLSDEEQRTALF